MSFSLNLYQYCTDYASCTNIKHHMNYASSHLEYFTVYKRNSTCKHNASIVECRYWGVHQCSKLLALTLENVRLYLKHYKIEYLLTYIQTCSYISLVHVIFMHSYVGTITVLSFHFFITNTRKLFREYTNKDNISRNGHTQGTYMYIRVLSTVELWPKRKQSRSIEAVHN